MSIYVGIDLGTTNSAICTYDGKEVTVWKSPEGNDITPSAIYKDRRGNTYYGTRAYNAAPQSPGNAALLFKRFMGTSTKVKFPALKQEMTPEECSAEILKVLYSYITKNINEAEIEGIVITIPAAFNLMQKDATVNAAKSVGFKNVTLMQEPVAAVMNIMQKDNEDGTFLVYDLGGGTFDVAIAEAEGGRVNLIAHGGIPMCGGRDFDRTLVDNVVKPWLRDNFDIDDSILQRQENHLMRMANWATEKAKIELSTAEETTISLQETELRERDQNDEEIYLDVPLTRDTYNKLIEQRINETIEATRDIIEKAGLQPTDIAKIVFIGGPTNYRPLRDKVAFELGIAANTSVNPMTAVAEGASIYAETIDWKSLKHEQKSSKGKLDLGNLDVEFVYKSRTSEAKARVITKVTGSIEPNMQIQFDSMDTGWSSGRYPLTNGQKINLTLPVTGTNSFKVFVFNSSGGVVELKQDVITIVRTAATIEGIPASHTISVITLDKVGGNEILDYLVREGENLPKEGKKIYKAAESIRAGSNKSLEFNLVEGDIESPARDNRPVGVFKVTGQDFDMGYITNGSDLEFDYKIGIDGSLNVQVSVPSIGATFNHQVYINVAQRPDFSTSNRQVEVGVEDVLERLDEIDEKVDSDKAREARRIAEEAKVLNKSASSPEDVGQAWNKLYEAKRLLSKVRTENLEIIRRMEYENSLEDYNQNVKKFAKPSEKSRFNNLYTTAETVIKRPDKEFDNIMNAISQEKFAILRQQPGFIISMFNYLIENEADYTDIHKFRALAAKGKELRDNGNIDELRGVIGELFQIRIRVNDAQEVSIVNIIRG